MSTPKRSSGGDVQKTERELRTYRACTHCRQRKSRCIFTDGPGKTPCARCYREGRDCIVAPVSQSKAQRRALQREQSIRFSEEAKDIVAEPEASVELDEGPSSFSGTQNPADALDFLARVASNTDGKSKSRPSISQEPQNGQVPSEMRFWLFPSLTSSTAILNPQNFAGTTGFISYRPIQEGYLSIPGAQNLVKRYRESYHSFFPIANEQILDPKNIYSKAREEPHLLTAILTIASKDDPNCSSIHLALSDHMQRLVSALVYTGPADVEAVEALLILAEWAPQPYSLITKVGRGEEDRGAWMQVGLAVRLGYLQGLDQTSRELNIHNGDTKRRRLAWAASYMSDRQISVRVGKAFWSRGPSNLAPSDLKECFNSRIEGNNEAAVFQANYDLTQLFSNAYDILYASRDHRDRLFSSGEYAKYLDDFRTALRHWHDSWGSISCHAHLKLSLILSYEYLRLYINAFAYQANLSRAVANSSSYYGSWSSQFATMAKQPDARFIYEALDAAKALLSTFSSFIDPVTCLRFMPLKYYLYVIYSAVFLYKAMATSVIGPDSNGTIRCMIQNIIDRLQKSSTRTDDLGNRYSRMLRLLWGKPPHSKDAGQDSLSRQSRTSPPSEPAQRQEGPLSLPQQQQERSMPPATPEGDQVLLGAFSWRDLDAVGQFVTNNNGVDSISVLSGSVGGFGLEAEDPFAYLENQGQMWFDFGSPPNNAMF